MLYPDNKLLSINGLPAISENGKVFVLSPGRKKIISVSEEKASLIPAEYYGAVYPYGPLNDPEKYYLTIVVTPACNLNCKYCSLSVGRGTGLVSVQYVILIPFRSGPMTIDGTYVLSPSVIVSPF